MILIKWRSSLRQLGTSEMTSAKVTVAVTTAQSHHSIWSVTLKVPKFKGISFETDIIERYYHRESSVEEALIGMYLAGVSI